jgi:hypothetical protein
MAFEFTDAEKLKIAAITGGEGGLSVLTAKLGLEPIPDDAVENELQRWIKYIESDPGIRNMAYNNRDTDGTYCFACAAKKNEFERTNKYGPIDANDYRVNGGIDTGTWSALKAAVVGYGHWAEHGKREGRKIAPIIDMGAKMEEIRTALNSYELNAAQLKNQMFTRFKSLGGFNEWNRTVDRFKNAFNATKGNILDSAAHAFVSVNPELAAGIIKKYTAHKAANNNRRRVGFVLNAEEQAAIDLMMVESNGQYVLKSNYKMDEFIKKTTPYDFDKKTRFIGMTGEEFDDKGYLKETDSYSAASDMGNWFSHSKLGLMFRSPDNSEGWHYSANYGWLYMDDAGVDGNYVNDGWIWSNDTGQWMYPMVGGSGGQKLYFATNIKGKDGKTQFLYIDTGGKITNNTADNTYWIHDGSNWTNLSKDGASPDIVKDRIDLLVDTDGFVEEGNKITDELVSVIPDGSYLDDKVDDIQAQIVKSDLEYNEIMDEQFDTVARPVEYEPSSTLPSGTDEANGQVADPISYDIDGGYGVDAAALTDYQMRLNEIARDLRYKGINEGLIPSLIKRTGLYKDLMDSLGGGDAAEAGQLLDMMVQAAAEKTAEDTNIAKNLTMFDARGGGMLDPMMNMQEKLAIRTAKPSRYATLDDVEKGYAQGVGQLIKNPDYDPSLSYYFEYRNPETGKLETRAFRPDMPGKQPFMENQERLIDGANMVIDSHLDTLLNRGEDGLSEYERKLEKTINALKAEGLIANEGLDDLYTKEGIKQLNYIFGDDEDSYTGKREDYNEMNKFLREKQNYYEGLAAKDTLDKAAKVIAAIEDTDPVSNARERAAQRMRLARFGGDIGSGDTLFDGSLKAKVNPVNLDNITGKGTLYTDEQLKELGIEGGLANAPTMTEALKANQYSKNLILPQ